MKKFSPSSLFMVVRLEKNVTDEELLSSISLEMLMNDTGEFCLNRKTAERIIKQNLSDYTSNSTPVILEFPLLPPVINKIDISDDLEVYEVLKREGHIKDE